MAMNPRSRQEFLHMQEQAVAAARDMQRRATLPTPPREGRIQDAGNRAGGRNQETWDRKQETGSRKQETRSPDFSGRNNPEFYRPDPSPQTVHHRKPSQQARQSASYGRIRSQESGARQQKKQQRWQEPPRAQFHKPQQGYRSAEPSYQHPPRGGTPPPPPRSDSSAAYGPAGMPPLSELFAMLGGMGGSAPQPNPLHAAFEIAPPGDEGTDSILMMVLLLLLRKENADQGLLLALMYIMI